MIIHNPTEVPVRDYPIQNPVDGSVQLWSILQGETLDFPEYVGAYLVQVYGFLQRVMTEKEVAEEQKKQADVRTGQHFTQIKVVPVMRSEPKPLTGEQIHQDNPNIKIPEQVPQVLPGGFTNQMMQPNAPVKQPQPKLTSEEQQQVESYRGADLPQGHDRVPKVRPQADLNTEQQDTVRQAQGVAPVPTPDLHENSY